MKPGMRSSQASGEVGRGAERTPSTDDRISSRPASPEQCDPMGEYGECAYGQCKDCRTPRLRFPVRRFVVGVATIGSGYYLRVGPLLIAWRRGSGVR